MGEWTDLIKLTVALLAIVDPIASIPIFLGTTTGYTQAERQRVTQVVGITVFCVLGVAGLIGTQVLRFFGISIPSFLIAGGILLLLMAIAMLQAHKSDIRQTPDEAAEAAERDAVAVVQRREMVRRITDEISGYVVELGTDGRLLALQLDELMAGVDADRTLVIRDYLPTGRKARTLDEALVELDLLTATEMIDLVAVAKAIGYGGVSDALDAAVSPAGFRLLAKVPRLPTPIVDRLVEHFGSLQRLLGATVEDLQAVEGVGDARARGVREGLSRLAEASILERYV